MKFERVAWIFFVVICLLIMHKLFATPPKTIPVKLARCAFDVVPVDEELFKLLPDVCPRVSMGRENCGEEMSDVGSEDNVADSDRPELSVVMCGRNDDYGGQNISV
jgi:hypothetical protein